MADVILTCKKFCKKCQVETERYAKGGCKPCARAHAIAWNSANSERHKATKAAWNAANPNKFKEYHAARYAKNPERCKAIGVAWRAANPERVKAYFAVQYAANPERKNAIDAAWYAKNTAKAIASHTAWREANPEASRIIAQNRRARKRANGGVLSKGLTAKLFKLQKGKCACCGLPLGNNFHLDHIMPLALGGSNIDDNMQLLRARCNIQKGAKHPQTFMQARGFLL